METRKPDLYRQASHAGYRVFSVEGSFAVQRAHAPMIAAAVLCDYACRMSFQAWQQPEAEALELSQVARLLGDLTAERAREKNRLHATNASRTAQPFFGRGRGLTSRVSANGNAAGAYHARCNHARA